MGGISSGAEAGGGTRNNNESPPYQTLESDIPVSGPTQIITNKATCPCGGTDSLPRGGALLCASLVGD